MDREVVSPEEIISTIVKKDNNPGEKINKLYAAITLPSYVHGYSLAIQYMTQWFESKFDREYFKGGIYVDGKHVLDDYKKFSKNIVKGLNPRARIVPTIEYDYDRETVDNYLAPPEIYLRKSKYNESFFRDYDRDIFLGLDMKALRMNFSFKVRVSTRSQQLDIYNRMEKSFRIGATQSEDISADFHIPKSIILNIADRAGFEIKNGEVVDIVDFLEYLNKHSDLPFLFKIRAINQKLEFFIRLNGLYTHISTKDKLQLDDGERDGKLDFNFHIEMNATLTIPIPHFYSYYSASDITTVIETKEKDDAVAIYSVNVFDIPKVDENGWAQAAITEYVTEEGDTEMDLSSIFTGDNILAQAINHDLNRGISPYKFINIKVYRGADVAKACNIKMDWNSKIAYFEQPENEDRLSIVVYYDRNYINTLDIELNKYNQNRIYNNNI